MEKIDEAERKKLEQFISDILEKKFEEMEFEQFLEDTADIVMQLRERIIELEEEVYND